MGLDIRAYTFTKHIGEYDCDYAWNEENPNQVQIRLSEDFPEQADDLASGLYSFIEEHHFHAGSYGGYNDFRNQLSLCMWNMNTKELWERYPDFSTLPFMEILNFTDCEGVIGPKTCAKLAKDFQIYQPIANDFADKDPEDFGAYSFRERYGKFRSFFDYTSDNGFVVFA